ncbi:MAG: 50S ribosomal protein L22 [Planctomycetes bacterium]|nr:50S ribosomal protein L22 [Planctomycetota bacterium]
MNQYRAVHRFARIGPRKARLVVDMIRGQDVNSAFETLRFTHKRAAFFVEKVLRSAVANASQDENVNVNRLVVSEARVDGGPLVQGRMRFRPGPMGRVMPIRKRTSHIHVVLAEEGVRGVAPAKEAPKVVDPKAELEARTKDQVDTSGSGETSGE